MATASAVAEHFRILSKNTLTPLQLLKLVYIAHGWSFPVRGVPLIPDRIEAWQYGPVIPDLYHSLKAFRASPVTAPITGMPFIQMDEADLVRNIFNIYGRYSGGQLSAMTHREGTPWAEAWARGKNSQITDEIIQRHYTQLNGERSG